MENELDTEPAAIAAAAAAAAAAPNEILRRFVTCVDEGEVRRELTDDCILNIFSRCAKGVAAVTGYLRTQVTGRYRHVNFVDASVCDAAQQQSLNGRFARSFEVLRRRLRNKKKIDYVVPIGNRRAESDEEPDSEAEKVPQQLAATPLRSAATAAVRLEYIEAFGVLEEHSNKESNDGGITLPTPCKVKLTLGYRLDDIGSSEVTPDICLVVYEKYSIAGSKLPYRGTRCLPSAHTDDESDEPATLSVSPTLFAAANEDVDVAAAQAAEDELVFAEENAAKSKSLITPRKRQHKKDTFTSSKRSMRF